MKYNIMEVLSKYSILNRIIFYTIIAISSPKLSFISYFSYFVFIKILIKLLGIPQIKDFSK